ncbi:MAG: NAD-dependent epimerase/dehydratase family protein [Thermoplasmatota archaeon]
MNILVTGGAGFIGSHAVDALVAAGHQVTVLDDLSSGSLEFLEQARDQCTFLEGNAADPATLDKAMHGMDSVWHFAANPEVRTGATDPGAHYDLNVAMTWQVLEAMRRNGVKNLVFTSTSTVYGNAHVMPTPEDYGPLLPISVYGGAKLACEALIASFAGTFDMDALLFRFANVVGPRSNHGVTYDFVHKLRANPNELTILGDGTQNKSYVHVADTVAAMLHAFTHAPPGVHPYNVGSADGITVTELAGIVSEVMGLSPTFTYTGGNGGAGWKGDVKFMGLSIAKLGELGWVPSMSSAEAIRDTATWLHSS